MAYESERGMPTTDQCTWSNSPTTLLFDGFYLKLLIAGVVVDSAWHARSGLPDADGWFNYAKARHAKSDVGPVPAGKYWILPSQTTIDP